MFGVYGMSEICSVQIITVSDGYVFATPCVSYSLLC